MSTTAAKKRTKSNNTGKGNAKPATRSNASQKGGKSGSSQQRTVPTFSKKEIEQMRKLQALGLSMTNIHRIIGEKHEGTRYYDVWKVLNQKN